MRKFVKIVKPIVKRVLNRVFGLITLEVPYTCPVEVTVRPVGDSRTQRQNRFLHGPLLDWWREELFELWGERLTDEGAKYVLKRTFDIGTMEEIHGKTVFIPASTKDISKADFIELFDKMCAFGMNHFGSTPPHPEWR